MSEQQASEQDPAVAQFALQKIFVKDVSFESPKAPDIFRGQWQPKVNLELNSSHKNIEGDLYQVDLQITVTARDQSDEVVYLIEVQQAGIFLVKGLEPQALMQTLGAFCPGVLFPYAREVIDSLVVKGSFPPLMLAPVNFDAIYEQSRQKREEATH